ncbi:MAG: hypothetical protein IJ866_00710 [Alphaproteobacteria bacterium]|nr:hypothetical protein [Alphaproteobacteria bacterium]
MKKQIKDMTKAEKLSRIERLSLKFHDIETIPSVLLSDEAKRTQSDKTIIDAINKLETLEIQSHQLEQAHSDVMARDLRPLKRIYDYETEKLAKKQESENQTYLSRRIPVPQHIQQKHISEKKELETKHANRKKAALAPTETKLAECKQKIYSVFMDAVRYLYR